MNQINPAIAVRRGAGPASGVVNIINRSRNPSEGRKKHALNAISVHRGARHGADQGVHGSGQRLGDRLVAARVDFDSNVRRLIIILNVVSSA